jgi:DNA invertase Pin-like site-specific DNA recombinase
MIAIYSRVSSTSQDTAAQDKDLKQWAGSQTEEVVWHKDKATGKNMNRPGFEKMMEGVRTGKITKVVVWRLDRLGRTAKGLHDLMEELVRLNCGFVSMKDAIDLSTASGRLMFSILASIAAFETEVRSERQRAGIAVARENGKAWGGRKVGTRITVTEEKEQAVKDLAAQGKKIAEIARVVGLGRQTCYKILGKWERKPVNENLEQVA